MLVASILFASTVEALGAKGDNLISEPCDLTGVWTQGWLPDYTGEPTAAVPALGGPHVTVRDAITPFGTPPAQYVVDYSVALALHPDLQTCLGNGTCSADQFGKARPVNSSAPPCSFIQWPTIDTQTDSSWCKTPWCGDFPVPPPLPPAPAMPWAGTYNLSRSTMVFVDGNHTGPNNAAREAVLAKYGLVTFGWETEVCNTARPSSSKSLCTYAGAEVAIDAAAARLKAVNPDVKVVHYRNTKLGISIYKDQCVKMYDPDYESFYLKNRSNDFKPINSPVIFPGDGVHCPEPATVGLGMDQYVTDFRNASAAAWFVDTVIGRVAQSKHADGVWFDDPSGIGAENPNELKVFTHVEIAEIRAATAVTLQKAGQSLIAVGKPLCFNSPGGLKTFPSVIKPTQNRSTDVCIAALRAGAALGAMNVPSIYQLGYTPNGSSVMTFDFQQHLAAFLLTRSQYSWFGFSWISAYDPVWYPEWDWDVGTPSGAMVEQEGGVFSRVWSKGTVTLNCSSWDVELPFTY